MKACGDFRWFVSPDGGPVRFLSADMIKCLPFCDPIGTHAWPEWLHLIAQIV